MRKYPVGFLILFIVLSISFLSFSLIRLYDSEIKFNANRQAKPTPERQFMDVLPATSQNIQLKHYSTFFNSTNMANISIGNPPSTAVNDILIFHAAIRKTTSGPLNISPPGGWTQIRRDESTDGTLVSIIYYKVVTAVETTNYNFMLNYPAKSAGGIAVYIGVNPQSPIDTHSGQTSMTASNIIAPSANAMAAGEHLLMFATYGKDAEISAPTEMNGKIWNIISNSSNGVTSMLAHMFLQIAGATGSKYATVAPVTSGIPGIGQLVILKPLYFGYPPTPTPTPYTQYTYPTPTPTPTPVTQYTYPTPTKTPTPTPVTQYTYPTPTKTPTPIPPYTYPTTIPTKTPTPIPQTQYAYTAPAPTKTPAPTPTPVPYNAPASVASDIGYPAMINDKILVNYPVVTAVYSQVPANNQTIKPLLSPSTDPQITNPAKVNTRTEKHAQFTPVPVKPTLQAPQVIPIIIVPPTLQAYSGKQLIDIEGDRGIHVEFSLQPIGSQIGSLFIGRITITGSDNRGRFEWDTTNVPNGSYQLFAKFIRDDGTNFMLKPVDISVKNVTESSKNATQNNIVFPADFNPEKIMVDQKTHIEKVVNTQTEDKKTGLTFTGISIPNSIVTLLIYSNPIVVTVKTDANGTWKYTLEKPLDPGKHAVYTVATKETGEKVRSEVAEFIIATGYAASANNESLILESANESQAINQFIYSTFFVVIVGILALLVLFSLKMRRRTA